ncbi:hypothetical protein [uncultured Kocuria sp.]|uniref:hypothetical protein n=1 Tax=uncultured Kocuria sp. TaxID=259305 RepID=UPI0025978672|nr:hypothetical protein [uncultured Kocuria sp.]MCT1368003.1 alkaline shock response membrane anchor protein AmaP [Rothia sp. p3-SID1597]
MKKTAGAFNRTWLTIIGCILLIAGVGWGLVAGGVFSSAGSTWAPDGTPLQGADGLLEAGWLAAATIAVGILLIIVALWWFIRQAPRSAGASTFRFQRDPRYGVTLVDSKVIASAIAEHVQTLTNVTDAKAGLKGERTNAELVLDVTVHERADLPTVTREIREQVVPAAARVLGGPLNSVGIAYSVTRNSRSKRTVQVQ